MNANFSYSNWNWSVSFLPSIRWTQSKERFTSYNSIQYWSALTPILLANYLPRLDLAEYPPHACRVSPSQPSQYPIYSTVLLPHAINEQFNKCNISPSLLLLTLIAWTAVSTCFLRSSSKMRIPCLYWWSETFQSSCSYTWFTTHTSVWDVLLQLCGSCSLLWWVSCSSSVGKLRSHLSDKSSHAVLFAGVERWILVRRRCYGVIVVSSSSGATVVWQSWLVCWNSSHLRAWMVIYRVTVLMRWYQYLLLKTSVFHALVDIRSMELIMIFSAHCSLVA